VKSIHQTLADRKTGKHVETALYTKHKNTENKIENRIIQLRHREKKC